MKNGYFKNETSLRENLLSKVNNNEVLSKINFK